MISNPSLSEPLAWRNLRSGDPLISLLIRPLSRRSRSLGATEAISTTEPLIKWQQMAGVSSRERLVNHFSLAAPVLIQSQCRSGLSTTAPIAIIDAGKPDYGPGRDSSSAFDALVNEKVQTLAVSVKIRSFGKWRAAESFLNILVLITLLFCGCSLEGLKLFQQLAHCRDRFSNMSWDADNIGIPSLVKHNTRCIPWRVRIDDGLLAAKIALVRCSHDHVCRQLRPGQLPVLPAKVLNLGFYWPVAGHVGE